MENYNQVPEDHTRRTLLAALLAIPHNKMLDPDVLEWQKRSYEKPDKGPLLDEEKKKCRGGAFLNTEDDRRLVSPMQETVFACIKRCVIVGAYEIVRWGTPLPGN
jgi:hypothetical protein